MATEWTQQAGMPSETEVSTLSGFVGDAEAAADAASGSASSASASASAAQVSATASAASAVASAASASSSQGFASAAADSAAEAAGYVAGAGVLASANNLSDLANVASARVNLGLGSSATTDAALYATAEQGSRADSAVQPNDNISTLTNDSGFTDNTGTVTSVDLTAGTGISVSGGPVTTSGAITVTNTAPDQTVVLTEGSNVTITGTYPNFTIASTDTNTTYTAGSGLSLTGTEFSIGATVVTSSYTGDVDITGEFVADSYNESYAAVTSTSNTTTIDCEAGNVFSHTLTENTTFTFSNPPATGTAYGFTLKLVQDSTARTVVWPASVDWAAATAPTISTGSGEVDVFVFFTHDGGTIWYGFTAGQAMS